MFEIVFLGILTLLLLVFGWGLSAGSSHLIGRMTEEELENSPIGDIVWRDLLMGAASLIASVLSAVYMGVVLCKYMLS